MTNKRLLEQHGINDPDALIELALDVAETAHIGQQYGKHGDYFSAHIVPVVLKCAEQNADCNMLQQKLICAALHDVLEDTDTIEEEIELLFGASVVATLQRLTRKKRKGYTQYIESMLVDPIATAVKYADSTVNLHYCMLDKKEKTALSVRYKKNLELINDYRKAQ